MFSIFSRYNALFVRPHIRCAIREYQTTLIDRVKADIVSLQETILDSKKKTMAVRVASNYDIPDFSANVMWLRQIEYQLYMNMKRIEDVLGEGWANHLEGTGILFSHIFDFKCKIVNCREGTEEGMRHAPSKAQHSADVQGMVRQNHLQVPGDQRQVIRD